MTDTYCPSPQRETNCAPEASGWLCPGQLVLRWHRVFQASICTFLPNESPLFFQDAAETSPRTTHPSQVRHPPRGPRHPVCLPCCPVLPYGHLWARLQPPLARKSFRRGTVLLTVFSPEHRRLGGAQGFRVLSWGHNSNTRAVAREHLGVLCAYSMS